MLEKNQKIIQKFQRFLTKQLEKVAATKEELVAFPYRNPAQKQAMITALMFWRFIRTFSAKLACDDDRKLNFLSDFLANDPLAIENSYLRIVAMIESLPTTVWRKLLWRENIDFSDYEPCLRRLNDEQKQALEDNYNDLFGAVPTTPRVLKKSWRDRVKLFFGIMSVEKIQAEKYEPLKRNASKGAYAFSLLDLDFGFSLYPQGDNNDTKITNKKYTRFFSVKEHINDFVVNQEDGKYWWLYKAARSNYAINPKGKIEMKTHVCPGFWLTLMLHTLFWIVSPIALVVTGLVVAKNGLSISSFWPVIFAFTMIIWSFIAIIRTIVSVLVKLTEKSKVARIILAAITILVLIFIAGMFLFVILFAIGNSIKGLTPVCGPLLSTLFVLTAVFYIFFFIFCAQKDKPLFKYKKIPAFVRFLMHATLAAFVIVLFDKFLAETIINFTVKIAKDLWHWYTGNLLLTNWFILSIPFFTLFIYFYDMFLRNEERFASLRKTFTWLSKGFLTITIVAFIILFWKARSFDVVEFGYIPSFALAFVFLAFAASIIMLDQVTLENIEERIKASHFIFKISNGISGLLYKSYVDKVVKSRWLNLLDRNEKWVIIDRIQDLAFYLFRDSIDYRIDFTELLITKGSLDIISLIENDVDKSDLAAYSDKEIFKMMEIIVNGKTVESALAKIEVKHNFNQKTFSRAKSFGLILAFPFILIYKILAWIIKKIGQFFGTIADLWIFLNKRCPFIAKSRYLG